MRYGREGRVLVLGVRVRDTHLRVMREVGRRRELEDELLARRFPAFELFERMADVAAEDDRAFVGLHDDDLMSGRVSRRRQQPDARQDLHLAVVLDYVAPGKSTHSRTV